MKILGLIFFASLFIQEMYAQQAGREAYYCESCPKRTLYYEYWDADSTIMNAKGYYCHGLPCKTWRYYHKNGKKRMKVKYGKTLKVKYFRDSGKLEKKGSARLDFSTSDIHFYWHGRWKYFDNRRRLYRVAIYTNGEETRLVKGPEYPLYFE
jgi:hypothetical protein